MKNKVIDSSLLCESIAITNFLYHKEINGELVNVTKQQLDDRKQIKEQFKKEIMKGFRK